MYANGHQSKRMTWFCQHDDFRFFFPSKYGNFGAICSKSILCGCALPFFFHQVAKIGAKKKTKQEQQPPYGHKM
jgi:hypothetical protein